MSVVSEAPRTDVRFDAGPVLRTSPLQRGATALLLCWPLLVVGVDLFMQAPDPDASWLIGWIAVVVVCLSGACVLTVARGFDLARLELPGIFAVTYPIFVMTGVPSMTQQHAAAPAAHLLPFVTVVAYLGVLGGAGAMRALPGRRVRRPDLGTSFLQIAGAITAVVVGLGLFAYYLSSVGTPPLVAVLRGERKNLAQARQTALVNVTDPLARYGFNFARLYVLPVLAAALMVRWARKRTLPAAMAGAGALGLGALTAALTLEKSPLVRLAAIVMLAMVLGAGVRISRLWTLVLVASAVAFPLAVLALGNPEAGLATVIRLLVDRVLIDPARVIFYYLDWAPRDSGGFLGGRLLPFIGSHAGKTVPVTEIISSRIFPGASVQGNANVAFVGSMWVDFGWWGVGLGSLFTGVALGVVQRVLDIIRGSALGVAVAALFAVQVVFLCLTSVFDAVLSIGMGVIDVLIFAYVWDRWLGRLPVRRRTATR